MKVHVGIAQFSPVVLDLSASVAKAVSLIEQASASGIQLLAFPEAWLPVYPLWVDTGSFSEWDNPASKRVYRRLYENSIEVGGKEFGRLCDACREQKVAVAIGVNERHSTHRSLYNSLLIIDASGQCVVHHRKLVPTFGERLVWAPGDAEGLRACETPFGRVGGLICWEHWMPLARQVLHDAGEIIHVACWPHGKERHQLASRHYAFEGRCFVLSAAMYLEKSSFPADYELLAELTSQPDILLEGGSSIIGPDGEYIAGPVYGKEVLLSAEIDTSRAVEESLSLDVSGHYSRPDIFELKVRSGRQAASRSNLEDTQPQRQRTGR